MTRAAEIRKAYVAGVSVAIAVETTGVVTGSAGHWLGVALTAVIAGSAAIGITFRTPNAPTAASIAAAVGRLSESEYAKLRATCAAESAAPSSYSVADHPTDDTPLQSLPLSEKEVN